MSTAWFYKFQMADADTAVKMAREAAEDKKVGR